MSSGKLNEKSVYFEINDSKIYGSLCIDHIDGDDLNPDKILILMRTFACSNSGASSDNRVSVVIPKDKTIIFSYFLRKAADVVEKWYEKDEFNK